MVTCYRKTETRIGTGGRQTFNEGSSSREHGDDDIEEAADRKGSEF